MVAEATVHLDELACVELTNTESRVEPYIWPALIWADSTTIGSLQVPFATIPVSDARRVVKGSMRAGEVAAVPASVGTLKMRFDETADNKHLILVVALLEHDETPWHAVKAGFEAYAKELQSAFRSRLLELAASRGDEAAQAVIVKAIEDQVSDAVESAVGDDLTPWEKTKVIAGSLNLDDAAGAGSIVFEVDEQDQLTSRPFAMAMEREVAGPWTPPRKSRTRYELRGRLDVELIPLDPCATEVRAFIEATAAVNGIEARIEALGDELHGQGEDRTPKADIIAELKRLRRQLAPAEAARAAALGALDRCRASARAGGPGVVTP